MPAPKQFEPVMNEAVQEEEEATPVAPKTHEVRLRNEEVPLVVSVDGDEHGKKFTERVTLIPNRWMKVPECIYLLLRNKFALRSDTRMVPDAVENQRNPHGRNDETIMREEAKPGYIIEFR